MVLQAEVIRQRFKGSDQQEEGGERVEELLERPDVKTFLQASGDSTAGVVRHEPVSVGN